jgi:catechol 2,3-dioxygenase-like lactoylglutathione lyase family enzyme
VVKIKHIAIRTPDPEKTATFYKDVFGLKEVGQARTGYYLSDGYLNLAILKSRDEGTDESPRDLPGVCRHPPPRLHGGRRGRDLPRLDAAGATPMTGRTDVRHAATSGARSYYKIKYRGPDNQEFDVTESGWIGT